MQLPSSPRFWAASAALLVLISAAGFFLLRGGGEATEEASASDALASVASGSLSADLPIPVEGAEVVLDTLVHSVAAAGRAEAWRRTTILARVAGQVERVAVRDGDAVRSGAPLIALDASEFELALADARARLETARASYRELTLFDERIREVGVREERERVARAKSGLAAAEIAVERAELDLDRATVRAPFDGRAASVEVVPGQWVRAGDEVLTIVQTDTIRVEVEVLEGEVVHLAPGREAKVRFAAFPDAAFTGRIESINPVVDPERRTARVAVIVQNPGGRILPGMYARVSLEAQRYPDRILVPRASILERDRRTMLFVYQPGEAGQGTAKWRYVTTGLENDSLVEIVESAETEGVRPGEVVLTDGHYTLIHDARVRLVEDAAAAGGRPE